MSQQQRYLINQMMRANPFDIGGDLAVQRPTFQQMLTHEPVPHDVVCTPMTLGGVPVLEVGIAGQRAAGTVLWFHGGAFAMGSATAAIGFASDVARRSRLRVLSVDYRLAPEHPYPAAASDALTAYRALLEAGTDPRTLAVAGESAGGNLALVTLLAARDAALAMPAACLLMSPWVDLAGTGASVRTKAAVDVSLTPAGMRTRAHDYLGGHDPADPAVSPIHADLHGLPPLLIQVGSNEILLDDAVRLAARAAADDVETTLEVTRLVSHVFQAFAAHLDEGGRALDHAAAFLRVHTT